MDLRFKTPCGHTFAIHGAVTKAFALADYSDNTLFNFIVLTAYEPEEELYFPILVNLLNGTATDLSGSGNGEILVDKS